MVSATSLFTSFLLVAGAVLAKPTPKAAKQPVVTYLGNQGKILCEFLKFHTIVRSLTNFSRWRIHEQGHRVHQRHCALFQRNHCGRRNRTSDCMITPHRSHHHTLLILPGPSHQEHRGNTQGGRNLVGLCHEDHRLPRQHGRLRRYERGLRCYAARPEARKNRRRGWKAAWQLLG